ncbi:flavin-containing amine oxidase [Ameyamaea chiangmaiensis NBRC 103196]|uniref:Tryptophan 2-monooxygenase n=1 Tax=Ameyamaea chiangmaiensis TaxID=442969 RepID=A0A850P659_9PROT|nr:flavin monoamine oxidase family protein [Ameyamaea chiangmaiensis]MBS4074026.1 flavin monoamine oxidase family protein [Ameyamaea chiangmaiensis]NVN39418.1 flavin monoamine oxidase family protein [Ameyamaea chiangmaiensis]GBQ67529.1 flavin-containing amine oxidase [Ameyamaea chiangmaiensis NBRC 103196]
MPEQHPFTPQTRRQLLTRIGVAAGTAAMYQAMTAMGHAAGTDFTSPPTLTGARKGTTVLVLGSGLAGMLAAYEMRKAGYNVRVLEFQNRAGGRNFTLHSGDSFTELGGASQSVKFAPGNYINPGPWRIPYHHQGLLHYCREFGVALEPFVEVNHNSYLHATNAFGGKPQRYRDVMSDFNGYTAEMLSKAVNQHKLDDILHPDEREHVLAAMAGWGTLDSSYRYVKSDRVSQRRGFAKPQGGGIDGAPIPSDLLPRDEIMASGLWNWLSFNMRLEMQTTMFQPVGGMDQIGKAFAKQVKDLITFGCKVSAIHQDDKGVSVTYTDVNHGNRTVEAKADYCVCTIPLSILSQLDVQVSGPMKAAIAAVPYASSVKVGLEFNRRFWEEDDQIYGGISFTDQQMSQISYPSHGYFSKGKAVLLGAYMFGSAAYDFAGMTPEQRIEAVLEQGSKIHPQYRKEFSNGVSWAWSRVPWTLGCCSMWSEQARKTHYKTLCEVDNRVVLAGEHASYIGCWQEGAILSSLDAITRLHKRAIGAA